MLFEMVIAGQLIFVDQTALSVGKLSALSADLGTIQAGYLNSVEIDSSHITTVTFITTIRATIKSTINPINIITKLVNFLLQIVPM